MTSKVSRGPSLARIAELRQEAKPRSPGRITVRKMRERALKQPLAFAYSTQP